ncbi:MAG TPA: hypothetical protein VIN69_03050 [Candidatus Limnocylindria bacterium]|jgi:hypothetical protein
MTAAKSGIAIRDDGFAISDAADSAPDAKARRGSYKQLYSTGMEERKRVKLHRTGGSRAAVIPRAWLERHGIAEDAVLYDTDRGIVVTKPDATRSIEDESEFAVFLEYLAKDAFAHPETLVNPRPLLDRAHRSTDAHRASSRRRK